MPGYEFPLNEVAACCGQPIIIEIRDGEIHPRCGCHRIEIEGWTTNPNGPSLRAVCDHACQKRIRLSSRVVQGGGGLLYRETYKTARGRIFESRGGTSFLVSLDAEDGRQIHCGSFSEAFTNLTGEVWRQPEGGEAL